MITFTLIPWQQQNYAESVPGAEDGSHYQESKSSLCISLSAIARRISAEVSRATTGSIPCGLVKIWFTTTRISARHATTMKGSKSDSNVQKPWTWSINSMNTSTKAVERARPGVIRTVDNIIFSRASNDTEPVSDCVSSTNISAQSTQMRRRHASTRVIAIFSAGFVEALPSPSIPGMMSESLRVEWSRWKKNQARV